MIQMVKNECKLQLEREETNLLPFLTCDNYRTQQSPRG